MKNMKKLMRAVATLGLTTVAAVNVVACGRPQSIEVNDLTKSFSSSYTNDISNSNNLYFLGLSLESKDGTAFTFNKNQINDAGINLVIREIPNGEATVNRGITVAKDPNNSPAPDIAENDLIAQVEIKTESGKLKTEGLKQTVTLAVTLHLWKVNSDLKYVNQNISMDVSIKIHTAISAKNLKDIKQFYEIPRLNIATSQLLNVSEQELRASSSFKEAVKNTIAIFDSQVDDSEYSIVLASSNAGNHLTTLNLTVESEVFVKIIATPQAKHLIANSQTEWLQVPLPTANNLNQLTPQNFGRLIPDDFSRLDGKVGKEDIIRAIAHNNTLLNILQQINSNVATILNVNEFKWTIAKDYNGDDITADIDVSTDPVDVFITLVAKNGMFSGQASEFRIQIPKLGN